MSLPARWWSLAVKKDPVSGTHEAPAREREPGALLTEKTARCGLCPHECSIPTGKWGYCGARRFDGEALESPYLGRFSSIAVDPIEKKPLLHWRPGSLIFSLGSLGCTMRCPFCQNHGIAHPSEGQPLRKLEAVSPEALVAILRKSKLNALAYTYNEPALQSEYILDAAPLLQEAAIATVLVSNGMYSQAVLHELAPVVDAANIDLKTFNARTYASLGGNLETVQNTISHFLSQGVHVEVTTLVVPGISDSAPEFEAEVEWLASLSRDIPLHISRYRPAWKYTKPPTDIALLQKFAAMAKARLKHVHLGNVPSALSRPSMENAGKRTL